MNKIITKDKLFDTKINLYLITFLIFLSSFIVYAPSLNNEFVWDDVINIQNEYYKFKNSDFKSIIIPKNLNKKRNSYYRPIIHFSIVLDYKIWRNNPIGYHISNGIFFSLSTVLFFFLILLVLREFKINKKELISIVATAIYIVHPMHVESVSWVAGRSDILCAIFFLSAFITHIISYKKLWLIPITILLFIFSFLSKETAIAFPFVMLLFDFLRTGKPNIKNSYISVFYFVILVALFLIRGREFNNFPGISPAKLEGITGGDFSYLDFLRSLQVILNSYLYYFYKMVIPVNFNAFISEVPKNILFSFFSWVFIALLFAISIFSYIKKSGFKAFCILWIILALVPSAMVSIINISSTPLAERYLFLPLCGFSLLVSYVLTPQFTKSKFRNYIAIGFIIILIIFLFININRQSVWKDRVTFWTDITSKTTSNAIPHINLGMAQIEKGMLDEGIETLNNSLNEDMSAPPRFKAIASNNLGIAYINKRDFYAAEKWFLKGIEFDPTFHKSYFHLGLIYFTINKNTNSYESLNKSEKYLLEAIRINKKYGRAYLLLANIEVKKNDIEQAKSYARNAIKSGLTDSLEKQAVNIINSIK